ncbi:MAG: hypothetical protein EHM35_14305, partial [Planctomycetaceae bacterium]
MLECVRYVLLALALVDGAVAGELSLQGTGPLFINEVMAANSSIATDPQGQYDDWIEIYNA